MKKTIILTVMLMGVVTANAQFKVKSTGNVHIGGDTGFYKLNVLCGNNGIYSYTNPTGSSSTSPSTAILGYANHTGNVTTIGVKGVVSANVSDVGAVFGLYGDAAGGASGKNYGVFGHIPASSYGAAIYGSTHTSCLGETLTGLYAGYFEGNVYVTGTMNVTGGINSLLLGHPGDNGEVGSTLLMGRMESNGLLTSQLRELSTTKFLIKEPSKEEGSEKERSLTEKQIYSKQHYGLSAEQLEEIFPDLVYDNGDGTKSVNYVEMVPILLQAINELSAKVEELECGESSSRKAKMATGLSSADEDLTLLSLGQNKPNPFGKATSIAVSVPEDVRTAFLYVYNLNGNKVAQVDITARGESSISFSASNLSDGMYLYSLIADGKVVETRRMIVEK